MDYYSVLEVEKSCTQEEIISSYKKKVLQYHPDKNKDNKELASINFKKIVQAYQILSDPIKRKNYDNKNSIDFQEIIDDILNKENDEIPNVIIELEVSINELYTGVIKEIKFSRYSPCNKCDGKGTKSKKNIYCSSCNGKGVFLNTSNGGKLNFILNEEQCNICEGSGLNPDIKKCSSCNGNKYIKEEIICDVDVPIGSYNNYSIKLENEGNYIPDDERKNNNERTDVIVIIKEINNIQNIKRGMYIKELNRINKSDLLIEIPITFEESICGFKKNIELINNNFIGIEFNNIILNGDIYVIKNCGFPIIEKKDEFGDLFICFSIIKPNLTIQQRKKIWQILTSTSYQEFDEINNIKNLIPLNTYIKDYS